jgi:hypothetical protein
MFSLKQPFEFITSSQKGLMLKLDCSFYGHKQAP